MSTAMASYKGHRYPVEIINHCVWLYFRFPLSFREVEELMLVRGVVVSYETIRRWCAKFGQDYTNKQSCAGRCPRLRRPVCTSTRSSRRSSCITCHPWRAVDQPAPSWTCWCKGQVAAKRQSSHGSLLVQRLMTARALSRW